MGVMLLLAMGYFVPFAGRQDTLEKLLLEAAETRNSILKYVLIHISCMRPYDLRSPLLSSSAQLYMKSNCARSADVRFPDLKTKNKRGLFLSKSTGDISV